MSNKSKTLLMMLLVLLVSCARGFHEPLDLTNWIHHRVRSGVFAPDREPAILTLHRESLWPGRGVELSRNSTLKITTELGSLYVKSDGSGRVVMYMNDGSAFSHMQIAPERTCSDVELEFPRNPVHPAR